MTSHYSKITNSPYSKTKYPEEDLPLRSKAFSHVDNIGQSQLPYQNGNTSANQDKIAEIKKKYDKLLSKSSNKSNQENINVVAPQIDYGRSVSTFENYDQNNRWGPYNKSYQTPVTNKDRRQADPYEMVELKNQAYKPYVQRQYANPAKTQVKSQLESNRMTLDAMKSQLQAKLKDLNSKTNVNSSIRNPNPKQFEQKEENTYSYQTILSKYSKNITQNKNRNSEYDRSYSQSKPQDREKKFQKKESLETKIKETSLSSYISKYAPPSKSNLLVVQNNAKGKQLSVISEVSNSNHSQETKQLHQLRDKNRSYEHTKLLEDKYCNAESNLIIQNPHANERKYDNWFKNTSSYAYVDTTNPKFQNKQEFKSQFTLQKLQNSEGLHIKRTTTQQNFMNFNKLNLVQARFQQKQKAADITEATRYQPTKKTQIRQPIHNLNQNHTANTSNKYNRKTQEQEKSQIQRLKEKYNIKEGSRYPNPYHEKRPEKLLKNDKIEPRNNELISKQIEKLDKKIKQIEQNKKENNIDFKPHEVSKSVPKIVQNSKISTLAYEKNNISQKHDIYSFIPASNIADSNTDKNKYNIRYQAYLERVKPLYSEITIPQSSKSHSSGFAIKLHPVQNNNDESQTQKSVSDSSKSRINDYINKVQLQNRTDTGIEERKKKLQDKVEMNNNIKTLVKAFGQQAIYDEVFRNNKIWFASEFQDKKWTDLKNQLNSISVNMSDSHIKEAFGLQESENNPFFSVSDNKCNIKSLAQSYKQSQRHWQQKILHKFNRTELQKEGFSYNKIDYDKKGSIQVEDLVRFLNIQSGTFLRNRDVSIIFKRMCNKENKLQFDQFFNLISG